MATVEQETYLTVAQVRRIDRLAVEQYHIPSIVLMENAARSALAAIVEFRPPAANVRATILVGAGNNGGDGLALARLMHNAGYTVRVVYAVKPDALTGDAAVNRDIVGAMGLACETLRDGDQVHLGRAEALFAASELVVDALLGTGLSGAVRSPLRELIGLLNAQPKLPVVALDIPSGFDADTGMPAGDGDGEAVVAELTVTFAANKVGFAQEGAEAYTGRVVVGPIGVPRELLRQVANT